MSMRFGLDLTIFGELADPALLVDLALVAEAAGWDGFFLWDHLLAPGADEATDPWVVLAAVAARTERIRLGPMVTPLARRRMPKLARETAALDHLSTGRFTLGVGLGQNDAAEFSAFGDEGDRVTRARILDESLELLDLLWSGQPVSFRGQHLQARTEPFLPTPRQQPRIPVWVAALWPHQRPLRRAARWDGVFPIKAGAGFEYQMTPQEMADAAAVIAAHRSATGPFDLVHAGLLSGDRRRDRALAASYAEAGVTWWLEHIYPGRMSVAAIRELIAPGPPRTG
jgi:alkanesulfonate monooxygenase SsuD/methylene tetrahydromethanopterin reductase-like flavin-dependent oxidoreductase (luciferase family)